MALLSVGLQLHNSGIAAQDLPHQLHHRYHAGFGRGAEDPNDHIRMLNEGFCRSLITHQWAHTLTLTRQWVVVPVVDEFFTVLLNVF
jgi:hypothetical protein